MTVKRMRWLLVGVAGIVLFTWVTVAVQQQVKKIDDKSLKDAPKGTEWLSYGMGWSEQRYSTMTKITPQNINKLALDWTFEVGPGGDAQKTNPLFSNGILYGVTNWSVAFAVDAKTHKEIWRYDPQVDPTMKQNPGARLCCGINSRGIAIYEGKVLLPVIDGRMQALDAATGKMLWSSWAIPEPKPGDVVSSYSITMAPRVAKGKVFIGNAGGEFPPFRGFVSAFDVNTGKLAWRFYITPGDPSKPFESKSLEVAAKTWAGEWWKQGGGGSMWDGMAYDPDENLIYVGTGNGATWASDVRNGGREVAHLDNLYIASILAINADTGVLKWHYQATPGDEWDYDAIQHLLLADIRINNRNRKVIMQANKNGYFYVIDRTNGEFISASEMSLVSWARGIDPKTGRPDIHPDALYSSARGVTVHPVQMHNTSQMSFNPNTGLIYVPISADSNFSFIAADTYTPTPGRQNFGMGATRGANVTLANPPTHGPERKNADGTPVRGGILTAWDPATQKERWFAIGGGQTGGGTLSTASNLVIQTLNNGHMKAFTADKGEQLMDITLPLPNGVGAPMTFMLDGKQYIAVMAGSGAPAGRGGRGGGAPPPAAGNQEATAAAAQRGAATQAPALPPGGGPPRGAAPGAQQPPVPAAGAGTATNTNPKMFVYSVPN